MTQHSQRSDRSPMTTAIYRVVLPAMVLIAAASVLAIPGYHETMTLWYKTGLDRTMLVVGQYCGLVALLLIYLQVAIAAGRPLLGPIFGEIALLRCHRINGGLIAITAVAHVMLVLVPEGISNLPIGWKFWPELVGAMLLLVLLIITASSYLRSIINLPFRAWRAFHKPAGYLAFVLVSVHVLFVSESFEQVVPRILIGFLFLLVSITAGAAKYHEVRTKRTSAPGKSSLLTSTLP